jgi:regulator of replication initiation timing
MRTVFIGVEDKLVEMQVERILKPKNLQLTFLSGPVTKEKVGQADLLIVHPSWRLPNLIPFMENLVVTKTVPIIYLQNVISTASFAKLASGSHFIRVSELKMEAELPVATELLLAFKAEMQPIVTENRALKSENELMKLMNQCKRHLMNQGLTEAQAHEKIVRTAMEERLSKHDACVRLLSEKITE